MRIVVAGLRHIAQFLLEVLGVEALHHTGALHVHTIVVVIVVLVVYVMVVVVVVVVVVAVDGPAPFVLCGLLVVAVRDLATTFLCDVAVLSLTMTMMMMTMVRRMDIARVVLLVGNHKEFFDAARNIARQECLSRSCGMTLIAMRARGMTTAFLQRWSVVLRIALTRDTVLRALVLLKLLHAIATLIALRPQAKHVVSIYRVAFFAVPTHWTTCSRCCCACLALLSLDNGLFLDIRQ